MPEPPPRPAPDPRSTAGVEDDGAGRPKRVLGSYKSYALAERAVDTLADRCFPVEHVTIVARDLTFVEQVTGRDTLGRAARRSAINGLAFGSLFGLLFGFFAWRDPVYSGLILAVYGAALGAVVGAIMGAIAHRASDGAHDFVSSAGMQAGGYDVLVDATHHDEAERILRGPAA
jgi:hypothetical protein